MNKSAIVKAVIEKLAENFENLRVRSAQTRAASNDPESKAEDKYDTRSTEENYLADGLGLLARQAEDAIEAFQNIPVRTFAPDEAIDMGALIMIGLPDGDEWFLYGPSGGGIEVTSNNTTVTVITPESPLGQKLTGKKAGSRPGFRDAVIREVR